MYPPQALARACPPAPDGGRWNESCQKRRRHWRGWTAAQLRPVSRTQTASSGSECSPQDPNCKHQMAVLLAGPEQQAMDQSAPRRPSAASARSQCTPRIKVFPPQPQRISEDMPDRMPEGMSKDMPGTYARKIIRKNVRKKSLGTWLGSLGESIFERQVALHTFGMHHFTQALGSATNDL